MPLTISLQELRAQFDGGVIGPDDEGYDVARRPFYGGIERRPAAIIRAGNAAAVARAVLLARDTGLPLAIRGGGHGLAGHSVCDDGIVLDLRELRGLDVDVGGHSAWAGAGLTTGAYTSAVAAHGLATGFGDTGSVGIGGITLGGGVGYLVRKYGLTVDQLLAADIVTADGQLLRVDEATHPDLFWAIRGGGGNFGVVTRFRFRLHDVDGVVGGMLLLPATPDVICSFVACAESAPDELSAIANVMPAPPLPYVPADQHGLVIMALLAYAGGAEAGERAVAPFRALATPIVDMVRPMAYPELFPPEQDDYHPVAAARTMFVDSVDRTMAESIIEYLNGSSATMRVAQLRVLGGAMARVPSAATAFAHRARRIMVNVGALYERPDEAAVHETWVADFAAVLHRSEGAYVNFLGAEGEARVREAYPGATWNRLVAIKRRYDPANLFRLNHNIPPH